MGADGTADNVGAKRDSSGGLLLAAGYRTATFLASGAEGSVHALDDETVAKVWNTRTSRQLQKIKVFYDALALTDLPFETPQVFDIVDLGGAHATIEKRLSGQPLHADRPGVSPILSSDNLAVLVDVLRALASADPAPGVESLPPLDEDDSPWSQESTFTSGLADLVGWRTERFASPLREALGDVEEIRDRTITALESIPPLAAGVVHGDLIPANILVGDDGRVSAVIDFGFFSTAGDASFDGAITPAIIDMYGPRAAETRARLDDAIGSALNLDSRTVQIYRAAYALTTSNAFSDDGDDGHFRWCVDLLRTPAVRDAVGFSLR